MTDIGLSLDLVIRRTKYAAEDQFKRACKQLKKVKTKAQKAMSTNALGEKRGRVYLERQNVRAMPLAKRKVKI